MIKIMRNINEARFITNLETRLCDDGEWILISDLIFYSKILGIYVIAKAGMKSDYASVPRIPFAYMLFGGCAEKAAVIHDALYSGTYSVTRKQADSVLVEAMKASGVAAWRRGPMWLAVRLFGASHYKPSEQAA